MTSADGFRLLPGYLSPGKQTELCHYLLALPSAVFFTPTMPRTGKPFSVRMTNLGPLGWVSDKDGGYRYQKHHPQTKAPWPAMPESIRQIWRDLADYRDPPEACLVNFYGPHAKMGLHVDGDEQAKTAPVVSISLGDTAVFKLGRTTRRGPCDRFNLSSGDVMVLGGAARNFYHGVDKILSGSSRLLPQGGRFNLTLRRVSL